jgi:uncharacterized membrane protein
VRERIRALERAVEAALVLGLFAATLLLVGGLALGLEASLRFGILILMFTPVVRVVVVAIGLFHEREWRFVAVSVLVLGVLASGMLVAARL